MNVIDRIQADARLIAAGQPKNHADNVVFVNGYLAIDGLPTYSDLVNTLLAWNRASDLCKSVSQSGAPARLRTAADRAEVSRLEEAKRDSAHRLNALIDRLPRGI